MSLEEYLKKLSDVNDPNEIKKNLGENFENNNVNYYDNNLKTRIKGIKDGFNEECSKVYSFMKGYMSNK